MFNFFFNSFSGSSRKNVVVKDIDETNTCIKQKPYVFLRFKKNKIR